MSDWGRRVYGEPCRECGFSWAITSKDAVSLVAATLDRLACLLTPAQGDERHPELAWSVVAYVAHVADNLRIWAERIAGITLGAPIDVARYDENALATARVYEAISIPGALWTLERSVRDWLEAVQMAPPDLVMTHPDRGTIGLEDVVRTNAHDAAHHEWDIRRSLRVGG